MVDVNGIAEELRLTQGEIRSFHFGQDFPLNRLENIFVFPEVQRLLFDGLVTLDFVEWLQSGVFVPSLVK